MSPFVLQNIQWLWQCYKNIDITESFLTFSGFMAVLGALDPKVILDLFSMYRDWQEDKVHKITHRQVRVLYDYLFLFVEYAVASK